MWLIKNNGIPPRNIIPPIEYQSLREFRQEKKSYKAKVEPTQGKKLDCKA